MTINYFKQLLSANNAIKITDDLIIFKDFELYSFKTQKGKQYKKIEDLINDNPNVKSIIENTEEFYLDYSGGRGSSSSSSRGTQKAFGHARRGGRENIRTPLLNAELNLDTAKGNSEKAILKRFQDKYGKANREYAVAIDENGYVHQHIKGGKHSVAITGDKGHLIIHNHPSGSHFSDADLISVASTMERGIIATSSNSKIKGTYTFTKTNHFKSKEFIKAVKTATVPKGSTYNEGVDKWLKENAKKYGYKYTKSRNADLKGM